MCLNELSSLLPSSSVKFSMAGMFPKSKWYVFVIYNYVYYSSFLILKAPNLLKLKKTLKYDCNANDTKFLSITIADIKNN